MMESTIPDKTPSQKTVIAGMIIFALVTSGIGFMAGRFSIITQFKKEIKVVGQVHTLGQLLKSREKESYARAFIDPEQALNIIDDISWAVPNVPTPFVGSGPSPGKHGTASINDFQLRSSRPFSIEKPQNVYRIFITGGSTAFGSGALSDESTIGGYLESLLNSHDHSSDLIYEVWTFANPAWASTHERIIIENRISEWNPDLVISFSGNNDVHWAGFGHNVMWFRSYADDFYMQLIRKAFAISGKGEVPDVTAAASPNIDPGTVVKRLLKNIELSTLALSRLGVDYVFVLQPTLAVSKKNLSEREKRSLREELYFQDCYRQIQQALSLYQHDRFHFIDLSSLFDQRLAAEDIFLDSYHFGDRGYADIAEAIYYKLINGNFL